MPLIDKHTWKVAIISLSLCVWSQWTFGQTVAELQGQFEEVSNAYQQKLSEYNETITTMIRWKGEVAAARAAVVRLESEAAATLERLEKIQILSRERPDISDVREKKAYVEAQEKLSKAEQKLAETTRQLAGKGAEARAIRVRLAGHADEATNLQRRIDNRKLRNLRQELSTETVVVARGELGCDDLTVRVCKDGALDLAKRSAVEQGSAVLIESLSLFEDTRVLGADDASGAKQILVDRIKSQVTGILANHEVLGNGWVGDTSYFYEIRATVRGLAADDVFDSSAESGFAVPPEPDEFAARAATGAALPSVGTSDVAKQQTAIATGDIARLLAAARDERLRIEESRKAALAGSNRSHGNMFAAIASKDMFESEDEFNRRYAEEAAAADLARARAVADIHRDHDAQLSNDVEPLVRQVERMLADDGRIPVEALTLGPYDAELEFFTGSFEVRSGTINTQANFVLPLPKEEARPVWEGRERLVGSVQLQITASKIGIKFDRFTITDPQSGNRIDGIRFFEAALPQGVEKQRAGSASLMNAAVELATQGDAATKDGGGLPYGWTEPYVHGYNRLVAEAKAAMADDAYIQALRDISFTPGVGGDNHYSVTRSVVAAARGLETYLAKFLPHEAFRTSAVELTTQGDAATKDGGNPSDSWTKPYVRWYNRLVAEAKAAMADDAYIQALRDISFTPGSGGDNSHSVTRSVVAAARGLETYLVKFLPHEALRTSAVELATQGDAATKDGGGLPYGWTEPYVRGYNRLVAEAKAAMADDAYIQALRDISFTPGVGGDNHYSVTRSVVAAARGLETYLAKFLPHEAFRTSAVELTTQGDAATKDGGNPSDSWTKPYVRWYNRLVAEAKAAMADDAYIQALRDISFTPGSGGDNSHSVTRSVVAAARGLETYLVKFLPHEALRTSAVELATQGDAATKDGEGLPYGWTEPYVREYNRLVAEAKAAMADDAYIQALRDISFTPGVGGDNHYSVTRSVVAAARSLETYLAKLTNQALPKTSNIAESASPKEKHASLPVPMYSGRYSPTARQLGLRLGRLFSPNAANEYGWTDLHYAAFLDLPGLAIALLDAGADSNARAQTGGDTFSRSLFRTLDLEYPDHWFDWFDSGRKDLSPLHGAAREGATLVASALIDGGAEVNARTDSGWTPLHYAAWYNHPELALLLIGSGADVVAATIDDYGTPLNVAMDRKNDKVVEILRRYGG